MQWRKVQETDTVSIIGHLNVNRDGDRIIDANITNIHGELVKIVFTGYGVEIYIPDEKPTVVETPSLPKVEQ